MFETENDCAYERGVRDGRDADLKRQLTRRVVALRRKAMKTESPYTPRYVVDQVVQPDGQRLQRLKVILMSNGCSIPTCTMCSFTNENNYDLRNTANDKMIVEQVRDVLRKDGPVADCNAVSLYNDGSFFAPLEINDEDRVSIAGLVAESGVSLLTVETLPQFINEDRLLPILDVLGDVEFEVGIGLQSAHPVVREYCVNTSFDNKSFERAVNLLKKYNVRVKPYILLKPAFLTDNEAIADALETVNYCKSLGLDYLTLTPTSISPNTLVWELMKAGKYDPLNLWSIVDTVIRAPKDVTLRVVGINLRGVDPVSIFPDSCYKCTNIVRKSIGQFSLGKYDLRELDRCTCAPSPDISVNIIDTNMLMDRIRETLSQLPPDSITKDRLNEEAAKLLHMASTRN